SRTRRNGPYLPIPAGIGQIEARFGKAALTRNFAFRIHFRRCNEAVKQHVEAAVETVFNRVAENRGKDEAARHKRNHAPESSACNKPKCETVTPHLPPPPACSRGRARSRLHLFRACGADAPRKPRSCWNPGRNPDRKDVRPVRCAKSRGPDDASYRRAGDIRAR